MTGSRKLNNKKKTYLKDFKVSVRRAHSESGYFPSFEIFIILKYSEGTLISVSIERFKPPTIIELSTKT